MNYQGYIIYRERLRRNWSQAGLCKGICTVSYLSKIESGKAEPSEEIVRLLLDRLDLEIDQEIEREAAKLADQGWELLFAGRFAKLSDLLHGKDKDRYRAVPAWLDLALLSSKSRWILHWNHAWIHGNWLCNGYYKGGKLRRCDSYLTHIPT